MMADINNAFDRHLIFDKYLIFIDLFRQNHKVVFVFLVTLELQNFDLCLYIEYTIADVCTM